VGGKFAIAISCVCSDGEGAKLLLQHEKRMSVDGDVFCHWWECFCFWALFLI